MLDRMVPSTDPICDLLWDHSRALTGTQEPIRCACGWTAPNDNPGWHRMHVAFVLNERIREVMAETWNEGVTAAFRGAIMRQNAADVKRLNPYTRDDNQTGDNA